MKTKLYVVCLLSAANIFAHAALYTYGGVAAAIPDNDVFGLSQSQTLSGLSTSITAMTLNFTLAGGLITDLTTASLRLGNLPESTFVDLTPSMSGSLSTPVTFTVDVSSSYSGQDPNNTWTLFFADTSPGGQTTLEGWSLDITAVPEPVSKALIIFIALLFTLSSFRFVWRKYRFSCEEEFLKG